MEKIRPSNPGPGLETDLEHPGSIEDAHKPEKTVEKDRVQRGLLAQVTDTPEKDKNPYFVKN